MYKPNPVNTDDIRLPDDLTAMIDVIARQVHETWAKERIAEGWSYGSEKDGEKKTTPCLVDYDDLPESERDYDRRTALETLKMLLKLGYKIEKDTE